jgi:hypothetical protein
VATSSSGTDSHRGADPTGDYVLARPFKDYAKAFSDLGLTMIEPLCSKTLLVAVRRNLRAGVS